MTTPANLLHNVIIPAESAFAGWWSSAPAILLTIAGQESNWQYRVQIPNGQAHGYWQCEIGGAVLSFCHDPRLANLRDSIVGYYDISAKDSATIFAAIVYHDQLACCVARCALLLDPAPLPPATLEAEEEAWNLYLRVWRPGKPRRDRWTGIWRTAVELVKDAV